LKNNTNFVGDFAAIVFNKPSLCLVL